MLHFRTACALLALLWAVPASAASITWSEPVRITTAEQTLGLPGRTIHAAVQFGSPTDIEVTLSTRKTVRFVAATFDDGKSPVADLRQASKRFASMFAFKGSGNDAFDRVLSGGAVEGRDASGVLTLRGLTPGKRYTVQLFSIDMRGRDGCGGDLTDCRRRPVDFGDGEGHFSKRVLEGSASYVLGTFIADRPTQTVIVRGWALNADGGEAWNLNAVVLSSLEARRGRSQIRGPGFGGTEATMAALNHLIIPAKDKDASAKFLAGILGVEPGPQWGPFRPVQTSNGVTLDFVTSQDVRTSHYAFLVDDAEFDSAFGRIKQAGLTYWSGPHKERPGEINHHWGGRGVYFEDPNGHLLELITKPYGDLAEIDT